MKNTLEELRAMAMGLLKTQEENVSLNAWGSNVKDLLQELSIYQIELEHQNAALDQSEKDLAASQAEYIRLFESAPVGYIVIDDKRIILKVNQTFRNLFVPMRAREENIVGHSFDEFVCPEFKSTFKVFCDMIRKPGIPIPVEIKLIDRFNNPHYVLLTAGERRESVTEFQLTVSDIAMLKKLETQLVREKEKAEESDRRKSHFLASVSHELRTPLSTMIGFSEMLDDPRLDKTARRECTSSIQSAGKILMSLADEILDLSVLESGIVPLRRSDTDIARICMETLSLMQQRITEKNILPRCELDHIPLLFTDPMRLRQMVGTVLEHAVGNAAEGNIIIHGDFEASDRQNGMLKLIFTGTNIFSGESSLDPDIHRKPISQNCAGLGMYLARQIIKTMGGEMIWEHPLDTLRIEIPMQISPNAKRREKMDQPETPPGGRVWRCLLVDDVILNLKVLAGMLRKLNFESMSACSGKDALELMKKHSFDLVLTDLWMPEMSGEELAVQIRQNPAYDKIPLIAVTADVEREQNFDMDFFAHTMIKPVNLEKIRELFTLLDSQSADSKQTMNHNINNNKESSHV